MADNPPSMDDVFGKPGSLLHEAWMDYICAFDPQTRLKAHIRLMAVQQFSKPPSPTDFVRICGI